MVTRSQTGGELDCKIVYYGPAASGKTTNLQYVYSRLDPATRGQLLTPKAEGDRTLFFDFLAVELGRIGDSRARLHLYTVPGQVRSNDTRRLVLQGVDGIVFVADSHAGRLDANVESLHNLDDNLTVVGLEIAKVPVVIQYNKRDLPEALPLRDLQATLNAEGHDSYEAIALQGMGVVESLTAISKQVVAALT